MSSIQSKLSSISPTLGWSNRFTPSRCRWTLWAALRSRNSSLRVTSSPTRSESSRSCGLRPASERSSATQSLAARSQSRWRSRACGSRKTYAAWQLMKALRIADRYDLTPCVSNQVHYSPYTREIENEIVKVAVDRGVGILVWSAIVGGLLSGKYQPRGRGTRRQPTPHGMERVSHPQPREAVRHHRRAQSHRRGLRRLSRTSGAGLHDGQAGRDVAHRRRPNGRPARRQPRRRGPGAGGRG